MEILTRGQYSGKVTRISSEGGITVSVTAYDKDTFNGSLHYHDNAHISFVLHGGCVEKKKSSYDRVPGRITYYSAMEPHQVMRIHRSSRHINLEIEEIFFVRNHVSDGTIYTAIQKNPGAKFLMLKIYRELLAGDDLSNCSIQMLLLRMVNETHKLQHPGMLPAWVQIVNELLHDRWNEKITLRELSEAANIHPVNISKYFPHYFSCTLGEYMRKLKVEKALALIKSSPVSLTEVAYDCGFADQSHFIRTFKTFTGFLPAAYQML